MDEDQGQRGGVPVTGIAALLRLAGIGAVLAAAAGGFAYAGGWLTPDRLSPARLVGQLEANAGPHPGFRRNHAKGVCVTGRFASSGAGQEWSRATVFRPGTVPVLGRFALPGGNPAAPDAAVPVRSMALQLTSPDGAVWRTGMNSSPAFPVRNAADFFALQQASAPDPATHRPDPAKLQAFLADHPETVRALALGRSFPPASGFGNGTYHSVNAFLLVDGAGRETPVRWAMVPEQPFAPFDARAAQGRDAVFDGLAAAVAQAPLRWRLMVTLAEPGDPTSDATAIWPPERRQVEFGVLTIAGVESEDDGACRDINFDPLTLPDGIAASDDPLLSARSAAYARSARLRDGEAKSPSAIAPPAASPRNAP
ncbi:catalase [Pseudoroseomonas deserti]|uniref:Catalase-related peroxidase n=1 Tax=Teichococcus deserti TaxID=1817963 RepID=A0A1V2GZM9_9PROT|nr:catalase family peroxidase [Pseudoroseomonas deserti]ONG51094.1 catalase [Pseudoroseomonas deserti]